VIPALSAASRFDRRIVVAELGQPMLQCFDGLAPVWIVQNIRLFCNTEANDLVEVPDAVGR
jgi:hypothetical protein